ncbi:MAG: Slp family lipoprotein [Nitrospirales bacterium]|nr:Slp family lipoprotein [Nitrospira sp.]MDR4502870.1 Slp family lipoprotein [Nitrospirales bacterium]
MLRHWSFTILAIGALILQSCSSTPYELPESLESAIDENLSFREISEDPAHYQGKLVRLGGEVLHVEGLKNGTQLEVLQLPLDDWHRPEHPRTASAGRFMAVNETFIDPATLPPNTRITIVGKITGFQVAPLDEMDYQYPTLTIRHLHVWENYSPPNYSENGPYWNIFGGGGTGIGSGGGVSVGIGF